MIYAYNVSIRSSAYKQTYMIYVMPYGMLKSRLQKPFYLYQCYTNTVTDLLSRPCHSLDRRRSYSRALNYRSNVQIVR